MKKLFALALVLAMVLTCAAALAEDYTIYLITMDLEDMHWVSVDEGAQAAVKEATDAGLSIRYVWSGPTTGKNDAAQIECINNAYSDNANVILLASNGPDTEVATIEQYDADGVKFIYVDSPANSDVALQTLATDNTAAGKLAGETLLAALTEAGVTEGKIGIVNVNAATVSTQQRATGFRQAFEGTAFEILEDVYTDGDAARSQEAATNFITDGCVALFGANEGCTVGTGNAIKAEEVRGRKYRATLLADRPHGRQPDAQYAPVKAAAHRINAVQHRFKQRLRAHVGRIIALLQPQYARAQVAQRHLYVPARDQHAQHAGRAVRQIQQTRLPAGAAGAWMLAIRFLHQAHFRKFGNDVAHAHFAQLRGARQRAARYERVFHDRP